MAGLTFHPGAVAVVAAVLLATLLLRRRHESWAALGFCRPQRLGSAIAWGIGTFAVLLLLLPVLLEPITVALRFPPQSLERLGDLQGDPIQYWILLLPLGWGTAAFGEELLYRGFLNARLTQLFGESSLAPVFGGLGQAVLFGLVHLYLGPTGVLDAFAIGLVAAGVYAADGRNLWPLIIAHGLVDTVGLTAIHLGMAHHG